MRYKHTVKRLAAICLMAVLFAGCGAGAGGMSGLGGLTESGTTGLDGAAGGSGAVSLSELPAYSGQPAVEVNGNAPDFAAEELTAEPFFALSELDDLGRCGAAEGCFGPETVTDKERGSIGHIRPSGWHTVKYPEVIPDRYLYNRCHLLMYKLSGILDDERNLITGTRYMNTAGQLPYEELAVDYIAASGNHVRYRVTPLYEGDNLVASGVLMEAESVEDGGEGLSYCVYCYNVQPGVVIDYATGDSWLAEAGASGSRAGSGAGGASEGDAGPYVVNTNTGKFHILSCKSVARIKEGHRMDFSGSRAEALAAGYEPCGICKP